MSHAMGQNWLTPWGNNNMNFQFTSDQVVLLETVANLWASWPKAYNFFTIFFYFWVGRYNKTLNDWPSRATVRFVSPWSQCFPRVQLGKNWGSRGNKTHCFPWGQSFKRLILFSCFSIRHFEARFKHRILHAPNIRLILSNIWLKFDS